ncbi:MAG: cation diffusion facilitator family transporter [Acidimicrobiales bacterium]
MSGGHDHPCGSGASRAGARHLGRLRAAFVLTLGFFAVEVAAAAVTGSLALLSDAGHMLTDAGGLGMALAAIGLASRQPQRPGRTFGLYRLEILAALVNSVLLLGVAGYVLVEAVRRLEDPPGVPGVPMLVVATLGLGVNLVALRLLSAGATESLNVEGASLEVLADAVGSVGVIAAAAVVVLTGWGWADPLAAVAIGLFILPRALRLAAKAVRILVQAAPPHIDLDAVRTDLAALAGVVDVHDLHLWTLTSEMEVASAHLMVAAGTEAHGVLDQARVLLRERYRVDHATLQVEPEDHRGCDEIRW